MKSYREFYNLMDLTEKNNEITDVFLGHVVTASGGRFSDASNSGKAIIRVPSGTTEKQIVSAFEIALTKLKLQKDNINIDKIVFKQKGDSGSGGYPAVVGGTPPEKGFSADKKGFRVYIDESDAESGESGGGGGKPKAADFEAAICVEYNFLKLGGSSNSDTILKLKGQQEKLMKSALDDAFSLQGGKKEKAITDYVNKAKPFNRKNKTKLTDVGSKVAANINGGPKILQHTGTGIGGNAPRTHYAGGRDKTPKTDIIGGSQEAKYRYSLKKVDDSSGAQLMSGKKDESKGVFKACWDSLVAGGRTKSKSEIGGKMENLLVEMEKKLSDNIKTTIGVAEIKKEYQKWLTEMFESAEFLKQVATKIADSSPSVDRKKYVWIPANSKNKTLKQTAKVEVVMEDGKVVGYVMPPTVIPNLQIQQYLIAQSRISGLLPALGKPLAYMIYTIQKVDEKWIMGEPIDVLSNRTYELENERKKLHDHFISGKSEEIAESTENIMKASLNGKILRDEISKTIAENDALKKLIVFEAASGWYKFSGKEIPMTDGGVDANAESTKPEVAHNIMDFSETGSVKIEKVSNFANSNFSLVSRIYVAFKGSGDTRYTSIRLPSPSATMGESFEQEFTLFSLIEHCVERNFRQMEQDILMENLWNRVKGALQRAGTGVSQFARDTAKKAASAVAAAASSAKRIVRDIISKGAQIIRELVSFGKRLLDSAVRSIVDAFSAVKNLIAEGMTKFLNFLGLGEPEGDFTLSG